MAQPPDVSILIPCKNEGELIRRTLDSILQAKTSTSFEIVVGDDDSADGCCAFLSEPHYRSRASLLPLGGVGSANARNRLAEAASGRVLLFCDAHIFVPDHWIDRLLAHLDRPGVDAVAPGIANEQQPSAVGWGMSWDEKLGVYWRGAPKGASGEVPILPGGCMAIRAETFREAGGFERGFRVWGREDEEFSLRLWLFGYQLRVTTAVRIRHVFRQAHPYAISMTHVHYNSLRMALSHFNERRIARVVELIRQSYMPGLTQALGELAMSDIWEQRERYRLRRQHDDDWFMQRFDIPF